MKPTASTYFRLALLLPVVIGALGYKLLCSVDLGEFGLGGLITISIESVYFGRIAYGLFAICAFFWLRGKSPRECVCGALYFPLILIPFEFGTFIAYLLTWSPQSQFGDETWMLLAVVSFSNLISGYLCVLLAISLYFILRKIRALQFDLRLVAKGMIQKAVS